MQQGSLTREPRRGGPDVWSFRWRERDGNGKTVLRRITVGSVGEYSTETEASRAIAGLVRQISSGDIRTQSSFMTIAELANHFVLRELAPDNPRRSYATKGGYKGNLRKWILPRWGQYRLPDVKAVEVESWLRTLHLANGSRSKLRDLMHQLYVHAFRYDLYSYPGGNPIHWVRQSARRRFVPDVLTASETRLILAERSGKEHLMVLIAAIDGFRRSELFGLKWKDFDFERKQINVQRSIVCQVEGSCKTESSTRPVPLDDRVDVALKEWRAQAFYAAPDDWLFASPFSRGKKPFWPNSSMKTIKRIAKRVGITKQIGWHTFRRSLATLMSEVGTKPKNIQGNMRHASVRTTMDVYAQPVPTSMRRAKRAVAREIFRDKKVA
jgi:integrase